MSTNFILFTGKALTTQLKSLSKNNIFLAIRLLMKGSKKLLLIYLSCLSCLLTNLFTHSRLLADEYKPVNYLKSAKLFIEQGLYEKAKAELELGLKGEPQNPDILNNLGAIYLRLSQTENKEDKHSHDLAKAEKYFTQVLKFNQTFSPAWNGLADTYYLGGNTRQAIFCYKKALSLSPRHAYEIQTNLANAQRDLNILPEAENNYQKALELNPSYAPAHNGYAQLLLHKNDLTQAYKEIIEAIRLKPEYSTAYYNLGMIETARENKMSALKAYLLSLRYEKNSNYAQETQNLINKLDIDSNDISFADLRKFQTEICHLANCNRTDQAVENKYIKKAKILSTLKVHKIENLTRPIINSQLSLNSIENLISSKQYEQAYKLTHNLLKTNPDEPVLLNELGIILYKQKKYLTAKDMLVKAINKSKNKLFAAYYNLGLVYLAQNSLSNAQKALETAKSLALKQNKNSALIDNLLAIIFKQKGDFAQAKSAYIQAIKNGGNKYPVFHYNFAILLEKLAQPNQAQKEFITYLRLAPNGSNALRAQKHLKSLPK